MRSGQEFTQQSRFLRGSSIPSGAASLCQSDGDGPCTPLGRFTTLLLDGASMQGPPSVSVRLAPSSNTVTSQQGLLEFQGRLGALGRLLRKASDKKLFELRRYLGPEALGRRLGFGVQMMCTDLHDRVAREDVLPRYEVVANCTEGVDVAARIDSLWV